MRTPARPARRLIAADRPERARLAVGAERAADAPAERDQVDVRLEEPLLGNQPPEDLVRERRRGPAVDPAETARHPVDVRVDGEGGAPAGEEQDAAGGLLPHSPQPPKVGLRPSDPEPRETAQA